jgi:hypothetical protein
MGGALTMNWESYATQFNFATGNGLQEYVEGMLMAVIQAFDGRFFGHARCTVKTGGKAYFASTTTFSGEVEWEPAPKRIGEVRGSVEAVWIFPEGAQPDLSVLDTVLERYRESHEAVVSTL